jgi:hypothetical protein
MGSGDTTSSGDSGRGCSKSSCKGSHAARSRGSHSRGGSDVVPLMQLCHVLHARHQMPDLKPAQVRALVAAQIAAAEPIRPAWYRPGKAASAGERTSSGGSSNGSSSSHESPASGSGKLPVAADAAEGGAAPGGSAAGRP